MSFYKYLKQHHLYVQGVTSRSFLEKSNLQVSRSSMCIFPLNKPDTKHYLTYILKSEISSGDMNENLDHWLDPFEKFQKKYIIMPSESLNYFFLEESWFINV